MRQVADVKKPPDIAERRQRLTLINQGRKDQPREERHLLDNVICVRWCVFVGQKAKSPQSCEKRLFFRDSYPAGDILLVYFLFVNSFNIN